MRKTELALHSMFIVCFLLSGCAVPEFLMNPPTVSEETQIQQSLDNVERWNGQHISAVIQRWGDPHGVTDDAEDVRIYLWHLPARAFLVVPKSEPMFSGRRANRVHPTLEADLMTQNLYELMLYTDKNGTIEKTILKQSAASEFSHPTAVQNSLRRNLVR